MTAPLLMVENVRAELLYRQFLDWRMGLDEDDEPTSRELADRERVPFATWLKERNEAPCVN